MAVKRMPTAARQSIRTTILRTGRTRRAKMWETVRHSLSIATRLRFVADLIQSHIPVVGQPPG